MANSNNWGEIYKSTWWGDKAWSANTLFIDSAPPGFGLNLLKASEDLDNTIDWDRLPDTTDVPTVSANTITDPNGGTTAERVDFTANRQARLQQRVTLEASKEYTFSVYAKVNTGTQNFRLRNVTLGDAESKTATTSWTRFSYTFTTTTAGDYDISLQNADNTARTLEFWGAMLNEGATAGDYVKTDGSFSGSAPAPAYSGFGDVYGGVTAYYSLRQFTEAETLNAIRVRRSSDDTEQDIGFDANGDLDTTALLAFVNEDITQYNYSTATQMVADFASVGGAESVDSVGGEEALKFTINASSGTHFPYRFNVFGGSGECSISFDYYLPSTNTDIDGIQMSDGSNDIGATQTTQDAWTSITVSGTLGGTAIYIFSKKGGLKSFTGNGTDVFYIKNLVVTQTTADGAVTTFYDQTGNGNDATNSTESEQPLVVSGGTLVEENSKAALDFDGVNDNFDISNFTSVPTISQFNVLTPSATNVDETFTSIQNATTTDGIFLGQGNLGTEAKFGLRNYQGADVADSGIAMTLQQYLLAAITTSTTAQIYANGVAGAISAKARGNVTGDTQIGANGASGNNYSGKFQEIIIFESDQSANRTGMETNINDHFDIYT